MDWDTVWVFFSQNRLTALQVSTGFSFEGGVVQIVETRKGVRSAVDRSLQ
jgi:hypothetical protein